MIAKNVASQGLYLYAHNVTADAPKTGDAANITGTISKDGAAAAAYATSNPTEIGGGVYWQPLSQAETNADAIACAWVSATSGVQIEPVICLTDRGAVAAQATASALATTDDKVDTIDGIVDAILEDTGTTLPGDLSTLQSTVEGVDANIGAAGAGLTALASAADLAVVDGIVDTMTAKLVGTVAAGTHNPQSGDAYARLGAPAGASVIADLGTATSATQNIILAVKAKTDNLPAAPAATGDIAAAIVAYDPPTKAELDSGLAALNDLSSAEAQTAAGAAITAAALATAAALDAVDNYVDSEVAAIKAVTDKLDTAIELDGSVYRLTANALEQAPAAEVSLTPEQIAAIAAGIEIDPQTIRDALKLAPTAGAPAAGSVDAHLDTIQAKTDTIGAAVVTYTTPVTSTGDAIVYAGQSHTGSLALSWTIANWSGPNLAGNSAVLRVIRAGYRAPNHRAADLEFAATVTQDGTTVTVTASLTDAQTSTLNEGQYRAQIIATVAGKDTIVRDFALTVRKALDTPTA